MNDLPSVLFVDDDIKILKMFTEFFSYSKSPKIKCTTCSEPLEVEELVKNNSYDVIFLDFHYNLSKNPELNGVDILDKINCIDNLPKIILLTGVSDIPVAVDSIKNGASDVLIKPIDLEQVKKIVLDNYFQRINKDKVENYDFDSSLDDTEVNDVNQSYDLEISHAIHVNSLYKLDEVFQFLALSMIEKDSKDEIFIFAGFNHKKEGYNTTFYKGSKSISSQTIDKILVKLTGSPRYKETKFVNYSQINDKKDSLDLFESYEFVYEGVFFAVYKKNKEARDYTHASTLFATSVGRVLGLEDKIKTMIEKVVEGSSVDFSNIMYKEL